jgi:hypothetical protein
MPTFKKKKGSFRWKESAKPTYLWYNGTVERYLLGDRINGKGPTVLAQPVGSFQDSAARIYPFKVHRGRQISDPVNKYLIAPKLFGGFWKHWDWNKAAEEGMKDAGLAYSGRYEFVDTVMYWGLTHEVMPKEYALSCAGCHPSLAESPSCGRCHQGRPGVDFNTLAHKGIDFNVLAGTGSDVGHLAGKSNYLDFQALGYAGDPIETGGRFNKLLFGKK